MGPDGGLVSVETVDSTEAGIKNSGDTFPDEGTAGAERGRAKLSWEWKHGSLVGAEWVRQERHDRCQRQSGPDGVESSRPRETT